MFCLQVAHLFSGESFYVLITPHSSVWHYTFQFPFTCKLLACSCTPNTRVTCVLLDGYSWWLLSCLRVTQESILICLWVTCKHLLSWHWAVLYITCKICDWRWDNLPLTHKDKYLEIRNSVIQSVISLEGLKLHAYNLLQICSYLIAKRLLTPHCTARCFSHHFRLFLSTP